jgi:hypothetical protein
MEELKMIVELASKVSDDAFMLVVMYFAKGIFTEILLAIVLVVMIVLIYKAAKYGIDRIGTENRTTKALIDIDKMLPNTARVYHPIIDSEVTSIINRIEKLLEENERLKK